TRPASGRSATSCAPAARPDARSAPAIHRDRGALDPNRPSRSSSTAACPARTAAFESLARAITSATSARAASSMCASTSMSYLPPRPPGPGPHERALEQAEGVALVHLAPLLPAHDGRGIDERDAPDGGLAGEPEPGVAAGAQSLDGIVDAAPRRRHRAGDVRPDLVEPGGAQ